MVMKLICSLLIAFALEGTTFGAHALQTPSQIPQGPRAPVVPPDPNIAQQRLLSDLDAYRTRQDFQQLLRRYAPFLGELFRLDPSLLNNQAFLAPYPNLAAFLAQHP